jgi:hypothetical protein
MQVNNKLRLIGLCLIFVAGCIDPFTPTIHEDQELLVIEGQLIDREGYQHINISRSSPYNNPFFIPEFGCHVEVVDDQGNIYNFDESMPGGLYSRWMHQEEFSPGVQYKVRVITSNGNVYESDYDMLIADCPPIDSVYYEIETHETDDPDLPMKGIQFFVDVDPDDEVDRNFRWELTETWEYWAAYTIQYYFDGKLHEMSNPWQFYRCWSTERISIIFIANTEHSTTNKIKKFPLHYVSNRSNRLRIKYSLLIRQYSMSDEAYDYWLELKTQSQETGGLYETQPPQVTGNIYNIDDPEERVLGYFNVSSVTEKRIFVDEQFAFGFPEQGCRLDTIITSYLYTLYGPYPIYMISVSQMGEGPPYGIGDGICFDCREGGGTTSQPPFWK